MSRQASDGRVSVGSSFWTDEDERRLRQLGREYEALISRRTCGRTTPHLVISAASIHEARRIRYDCFPRPDLLFGEPAWDMLLDLANARERRHTVSASSASIGARAASTTARRYILLLERLGLVERCRSPDDGRAVLVALSPGGAARMEDYLSRLAG